MSQTQSKIDVLYRKWTDGPKYTLVQPNSHPEFLSRANTIGGPEILFDWIIKFPNSIGTFYVDVSCVCIHKMKKARPELDIIQIQHDQI
jgi:hypothetical protein